MGAGIVRAAARPRPYARADSFGAIAARARCLLGKNGGLPLPRRARTSRSRRCAHWCVSRPRALAADEPRLGVVVALVPLLFAWRSLFSYFFLVPLFAAVAVARKPLGDLTPERARAAGALTLFAVPARRLALVARRGRAA